jgi:folate-binding protein YgfZ
MHTPLHGVAALTHLGLIRAQGEDAAKFVHGQLTNDFTQLGLSEARLAAFCNAKGRMQASMIGFKLSPTDILLVCHRDLLVSTLKRLSMFVMRAKLKLTDASADFSLYGLSGEALAVAAQSVAGYSLAAWAKSSFQEGSLINLHPAQGVARALWVAPVGAPAPAGAVLSSEQWAWGEVQSGITTLSQAVFEAFVPQMLNYESVGGVNFKKGCYPGQEVVARSQFRGTLKRRAYLAHSDQALTPGQELFGADANGQPCGQVVQVAAAPGGGFDAIVSMQISAFESGQVYADQAASVALMLAPTPYPLLAEV